MRALSAADGGDNRPVSQGRGNSTHAKPPPPISRLYGQNPRAVWPPTPVKTATALPPASQRAMIAAELANLQHGQRADRVEGSIDLSTAAKLLNVSERAMIAAELATMQSGTRTDLAPNGARSDAQAAQLLNVSERSVERAKAVKREAIPEVVELANLQDGSGRPGSWVN